MEYCTRSGNQRLRKELAFVHRRPVTLHFSSLWGSTASFQGIQICNQRYDFLVVFHHTVRWKRKSLVTAGKTWLMSDSSVDRSFGRPGQGFLKDKEYWCNRLMWAKSTCNHKPNPFFLLWRILLGSVILGATVRITATSTFSFPWSHWQWVRPYENAANRIKTWI